MRDTEDDPYGELRKKILGLGESSFRKTYYPVLQHKLVELERFRTILDYINDIVFLVSFPDGIIVDFNSRVTDKMGCLPGEIVGKEIKSFLFDDSGNPLSLEKMRNRAERVLIRGKVCGRPGITVSVEADLSFSEYGDDTYCAIVCRDINERLQMENMILESESQYRTTIESINEGILLVNSSGRSVIYNRAIEEIYYRFTGEELPDRFTATAILKKIGFFREDGITGDTDPDYFVFSPGVEERIEKVPLEDKIAVLKLNKIPIMNEYRHEQSVLIVSDITLSTVLDEIRKDVFYQINRNMEQFAILNDEIRNPLQAILGTIEMKSPDLSAEIEPFINEINKIVRKLDIGWLESEKVRSMIRKHYGVSILEKDEIGDAVQYLKEFGFDDMINVNQ